MLVAVFLLFVVGAMAALSIDVVTLYTARSEAQLAADAGALAGARVFANSGVTSDASRRSTRNARTLATTIATQVASQNLVGGRTLNPATGAGEIAVSFNETDTGFDTNPHVTVKTQRADLPTFFARIWGRTVNTVGASATAEAYNPSGANALGETAVPVAPLCVKPWLLPNIDPTGASTNTIFNPDGSITAPGLVGKGWPGPSNSNGIYALCNGDCSPGNGGIVPASRAHITPGLLMRLTFRFLRRAYLAAPLASIHINLPSLVAYRRPLCVAQILPSKLILTPTRPPPGLATATQLRRQIPLFTT